ncbi:MAG: oligosaccharide repeat unit polymerase [Methanobacteriota archaeon]|nr:MAG: oligosaccharide repeat unit polymerase [Euryarchaeota archaeon]
MTFTEILLDSRTARFLQGSVGFFEGAARDSAAVRTAYSALARLYPQRIYDAMDRLNQRQESFLSRNIASPAVIFPLIYVLFISIGSYRLSNLAILSVALGLLFFYLGVMSPAFHFTEIKLNERTKEMGIFLFLTGLLFLAADLLSAGAIPLLNPSARRRLVVLYTMLAQLIPPGGILLIAFFGEGYRKGDLELKKARIYGFAMLAVTLLLISTLGFRTQIIVTLLGGLTAMYLTGLVGFVEVMAGLGLAAAGIALLGYLRAVIEGSPIGPLEVMGARIGLTLSVYDYLVKRFMPFGANRGYTLLASFSSFIPGIPGPRLGPRTIVARLFGITGISVTSTLLGTIVLDFGIVGVILFMFLLGHVLGTGYRAARTGAAMGVGIYSLLLAYSIVGIETGLVDFNVLMMFSIGYLLLRSSEKGAKTCS